MTLGLLLLVLVGVLGVFVAFACFVAGLFPPNYKKRRLWEIQNTLIDLQIELEDAEDVFTRQRIFNEMEELLEERSDLYREDSRI